MLLTGAEIIWECLIAEGVDIVYGYPGGAILPTYDALSKYEGKGIHHVLVRHEQGATHMADGYARVTGQPGVCLAVAGPGVYNAATAVATAYSDSQPVLLLSGQVPVSKHGVRSGYYHENEQLAACAAPEGAVVAA